MAKQGAFVQPRCGTTNMEREAPVPRPFALALALVLLVFWPCPVRAEPPSGSVDVIFVADGAGNFQAPPSLPNLTLTETFAQPAALQVTGLTV